MDEPDWDREPVSEPDWVYDPPGEHDPSDEVVAVDETPGIRRRHPMAYERWSPEAEAKLVAGYLAGRSIDQLAVEFGRRPSAIQCRLEQHAFAEWTQRHTARSPGTLRRPFWRFDADVALGQRLVGSHSARSPGLVIRLTGWPGAVYDLVIGNAGDRLMVMASTPSQSPAPGWVACRVRPSR